MSDGYTPREGTNAHTILEFLRKQPAGAAFTGKELDDRLKIKFAAMALRKAVEAEAVTTEKRGNAFVFSLAAPPQPTDGKLQIGNWSDGDVTVSGGVIAEDGSVTYTREQITQLLQHVTQPHIAGSAALLAVAARES